jgi:hypothetical protein
LHTRTALGPGVQCLLCAGVSAERHGDRAAHDLRVAPRLKLEPSFERADQPGGEKQGRAAIDHNRHDELRRRAGGARTAAGALRGQRGMRAYQGQQRCRRNRTARLPSKTEAHCDLLLCLPQATAAQRESFMPHEVNLARAVEPVGKARIEHPGADTH